MVVSLVRILLVLNKGRSDDFKVMVRLHSEKLIKSVNSLISQQRAKDAFDLIVSKAEVEDYIPAGKKVSNKPALTLIEDIL